MKKFGRRHTKVAAILVSVVSLSACGSKASTTAPTATTPAAAAVTETFAGVLAVGGSRFYSYSIPADGQVTATLASITGDGVPPSVVVNLGFGVPSAFGCTAGGSAVQITGTAQLSSSISESEAAGVHCLQISDIGNLFAPASFVITIDHP